MSSYASVGLAYIRIPDRLMPKTCGEVYRIVAAVPKHGRWEIVDIKDGRVYYRPVP